MNEDIEQATEALTSTMNNDAVPMPMINISAEIESSLLYLLKHRITRVEKDAIYEDRLKEAIMDRLPEATFSELIQGLKLVQQETNSSTGNILKPFIPSSERVPLMDNKDANGGNKEAGEIAFANAPKEVLQSLGELNKLLKILGTNNDGATAEAGSSSTEK
jgi:hypothetical protein